MSKRRDDETKRVLTTSIELKHPNTVRSYPRARTRVLCDQGASGGALVLPVWRQVANGLVVTAQAMDTTLDQNQAELCVAVLSVSLQVLSDRDGLFDQLVQILWDLGGKSIGLENAENFVSGDILDLGNAVRVTQNDANLVG